MREDGLKWGELEGRVAVTHAEDDEESTLSSLETIHTQHI